VETPGGAVRSYSLTNDPVEAHRYVIAVKREGRGRGGSASMVNDTAEGATVRVSPPSNSFPLVGASKLLFVAGGIGITPILSMMRSLLRRGDGDFRLIYCSRSAADAAYLPELSAPGFSDRVIVHHDEGDRDRAFDFWPFLMVPDDTHVYCCGPAQLMEHIRTLTVHWPPGAVHFEDFAGVSALGGTSRPFRVKRSSSSEFFEIPADKTVLEVLRERGFDLPSSCESGTCGTCKMKVVMGDVEHRDLVLNGAERRTFIMPCVSRAAGDEIELDF
jgi:phthalate 4,5-dioxygenase reductase subunit